MITVVALIGLIFALLLVPIAVVLGFVGLWLGGTWGAAAGVIIGILVQLDLG